VQASGYEAGGRWCRVGTQFGTRASRRCAWAKQMALTSQRFRWSEVFRLVGVTGFEPATSSSRTRSDVRKRARNGEIPPVGVHRRPPGAARFVQQLMKHPGRGCWAEPGHRGRRRRAPAVRRRRAAIRPHRRQGRRCRAEFDARPSRSSGAKQAVGDGAGDGGDQGQSGQHGGLHGVVEVGLARPDGRCRLVGVV
jgi:hypothetical protein